MEALPMYTGLENTGTKKKLTLYALLCEYIAHYQVLWNSGLTMSGI